MPRYILLFKNKKRINFPSGILPPQSLVIILFFICSLLLVCALCAEPLLIKKRIKIFIENGKTVSNWGRDTNFVRFFSITIRTNLFEILLQAMVLSYSNGKHKCKFPWKGSSIHRLKTVYAACEPGQLVWFLKKEIYTHKYKQTNFRWEHTLINVWAVCGRRVSNILCDENVWRQCIKMLNTYLFERYYGDLASMLISIWN